MLVPLVKFFGGVSDFVFLIGWDPKLGPFDQDLLTRTLVVVVHHWWRLVECRIAVSRLLPDPSMDCTKPAHW